MKHPLLPMAPLLGPMAEMTQLPSPLLCLPPMGPMAQMTVVVHGPVVVVHGLLLCYAKGSLWA